MGKLKVKRKGYTAKRGKTKYRVKPTTFYIKDRGKKGRGRKILPELKKGELTKHGFHIRNSAASRRRALAKSVKEDGYKATLGRLIALQVLFKRTHPSYAKRLIADRKWLVKTYGKGV